MVSRPGFLPFAALLATLFLARGAFALDLPELAAVIRPSVVLLKISDSSHATSATGTGFFITADGRIVTNHHVIEGATRVVAVTSEGKEVGVTGILADDEKNDLAVLQAETGGWAPLTLGSTSSLKVGDEIAIIGSPLGLSGSLSTGIVSAMREHGPTSPFHDDPDKEGVNSWGLQVTAAVSPGSSGSPILLRNGEVVAVAVGKVTAGEALNFGIPVELLRTMLASIPAGAKAKSFEKNKGSAVRRNLLISAAVFGVPFVAFVVVSAWKKRAEARLRAAKRLH